MKTKRRPAWRSTEDYVAAVGRMIVAAGRRVAREDPEQLASLCSLKPVLDQAIRLAVAGQKTNGITWQSIGDATGTSREAAFQKWGQPKGQHQ